MSWTLDEIIKVNNWAKKKFKAQPYKMFEGSNGIYVVERMDTELWSVSKFDPLSGDVYVISESHQPMLIRSRKKAFSRASALATGMTYTTMFVDGVLERTKVKGEK